jgi:hypothetical protein
MDPYLELEISIDASDEEIKAQYRALAMIHHPDKGGDEEKFKLIKEAYEILSDPIRRKGYDMSGDAESNLQIRNSALDHIAQMVNQIVPEFDSEQGDLIAIMNLEVTKIRQAMFENINVCNKYLANLDKVIVRINAKHNKQNIMLELVQKQIDHRKREHEDFTKRIQICDLEIEILKDYEYGLVERIALPNTLSE